MRTMQGDFGTKLWLSRNDTYYWADGQLGNGRWPCSVLSGRSLYAEFDARGNLVDVAVNGRDGVDVPADEFNAICSDFLRQKFGANHPAIR